MNNKTCEFVSPNHPDKVCDFIADSILDEYLKQDPDSRVAVEVMGGHKHISVSGEITSGGHVDIDQLIKKIVGKDFTVSIFATKQSPFIAKGVDTGGAGDQGIMEGFATSETPEFMPKEYQLTRMLCQKIYEKYPFDGKVQITLDNNDISAVVASFQDTKTEDLKSLVKKLINAQEYFINPIGEWSLGGFDSDTGLSGRKIIIDNYGPEVSVGGGSFSGKDYTKVDRSGAYMARKIAVDLLKKYGAKEVMVKMAYVIGKKEPVMAVALLDGKLMPVPTTYDLSPKGIRELLKLDQQNYANISRWGHFGRNFAWDN